MEKFGKFMTLVLIMILSQIMFGFVFSKLWAWFIVPVFDAPALRLVEAIGIMLLLGFLTAKMPKDEEKDFWKDLTKKVIFSVSVCIIALLFGWIITLFL